jgi:hypothetical protein
MVMVCDSAALCSTVLVGALVLPGCPCPISMPDDISILRLYLAYYFL